MFETTTEELVLALQSTTERLTIELTDSATGALVDATALSLRITNLAGGVVYLDNLLAPPTPPGVTRIQHPSLGKYYFPLGDQTVIANRETEDVGEYLAIWHVEVGADADNFVQTIKVVTPYTIHLVGALRRQIDKAVMQVIEDPANPCFLGYTNKALVEYLEGGLQTINTYQPYPTFCGLEDFPHIFKQTLIEAALIVGIQSQELFAIAKDIPSYSAQGAAFVIQHQPQLAQFATRISQRLDKLVPMMKLHLVRSGSIHTQVAPNARLQALINMSPNGALFRNAFLSG